MTGPLARPTQLPLAFDPGAPGRQTGALKNAALRLLVDDVTLFSSQMAGLRLRSYQAAAARAIIRSVIERLGLSFVVMFPRQSGKNEVQAQIEAYLLTLFRSMDVSMVKISPTWKPQAINAMQRLERVLRENVLTAGKWSKEKGYIYRVGKARMIFLSGAPTSNVVGATASLLLECDEAQDITLAKWDKEINPMAASQNATRVFWGTAWTGATLLGRELHRARQAEAADGLPRAFTLTADQVRQEVEPYGVFVDNEIARLGRNHPLVRTQYFCEELNGDGGMFPAERRALMQGDHPPLHSPSAAGYPIAFLIDVAGEAESGTDPFDFVGGFAGQLQDNRRDSTALTIVAVDLTALDDPLINAPRYLVVHRRLWTGVKHTDLYTQLNALAGHWSPQRIVIDATGVGAGLASFLRKAFPAQVVPFIFTAKSKSELGWGFLAVIETGRYKEHRPENPSAGPPTLQEIFFKQLEYCQMEKALGEEKRLRWGVPAGQRDRETGELLHDDLVISAALCARLDDQVWGAAHSAIVAPPNLFTGLSPAW